MVETPQKGETIQSRKLLQSLGLAGQETRWCHGRPETSWVRARTRERHLGACLVPKAQRGASLFPSLRLTSSCVASHRPDPQGSQRARKWEKTALQGDTEQSRGRAGAGAESPHAVTVLDTPSGLCDPPAATPWGSKTLKPLGA